MLSAFGFIDMNKAISKKTVVIGASENPARYAFRAVHQLKNSGHEVIPIGLKPGAIGDIKILNNFPLIEDVHTVSLYIRPSVQKNYEDYIINLKPKRIIFNPGTENPGLVRKAKAEGIAAEIGCTLVMLSIADY